MIRTLGMAVAGGLLATALAAGPSSAQTVPGYATEAVAFSGRPARDTDRDAARKPAEMVAFAGLKPGDKVGELLPGGGYFTRIFSKVVGPKGHVYAVTFPVTMPAKPAPAPGAAPAAPPPPRPTVQDVIADPAFGNVTASTTPGAQFAAPEPLDVVWTSENYHDLHNAMFGPMDMAALNKAVFASLKPGGVYIVADHAAVAGSGASATSTLHRIDPALVKAEVEAAGFKLDGESTAVSNPADPHTAPIFDPSIRGKTDQFVLKFRKPG